MVVLVSKDPADPAAYPVPQDSLVARVRLDCAGQMDFLAHPELPDFQGLLVRPVYLVSMVGLVHKVLQVLKVRKHVFLQFSGMNLEFESSSVSCKTKLSFCRCYRHPWTAWNPRSTRRRRTPGTTGFHRPTWSAWKQRFTWIPRSSRIYWTPRFDTVSLERSNYTCRLHIQCMVSCMFKCERD